MANRTPKPVKQANAKRDTRFKSGKDWNGNAKGRPSKAHCTSSLLAELLKGDPQQISIEWKQKPTGAMIVAMALFAKMGRGDLTAIKEGLDRVEGRVPQPVEHGGMENGPPIKFTVHFDKPGDTVVTSDAG